MTGIIILAAGSSSRMGQSKQLLPIDGKPLLARTAKEALKITQHVVVVLGSNFEEHRKSISGLSVVVVQNKNWEKGMGRSLKVGLRELLNQQPSPEAAIVLVCDQPLLTAAHLKKLIHQSETPGISAVASAYAGTLGVPALFKKNLFGELEILGDGEGAKKVIMQNKLRIAQVDFPEGKTDLDTPEDYTDFLGNYPVVPKLS